jgi:uncharacterized repeat protein (TIGR01451 family)
MIKYIVLALTILAIPTTVSAGTGQYGQYGGGAPSYSIVVDKMVATKDGTTKGGQPVYVDNLTPADARYIPGDQIAFQVKIRNTSNINLTNVKVQDVLPDWLDAAEGPGNYDGATRTITWTYPQLLAGEERTERVVAQVKPQDQLPADKGLMCMNNKAVVSADNAYDEDTAQLCVEKQVTMVTTKGGQPITQNPEAGAPLLVIGAFNLLALGAGVYMKKLTS